MLEDADVACHQRGCREAYRLPEREVPRHDRQYDAEWLVAHVCATGANGLGVGGLVGKHGGTVVGVVAKSLRALQCFCLGGGKGLAHLLGHHGCDTVRFGFEQVGGGTQPGRPLLERRRAIAGESTDRAVERLVDLRFCQGIELPDSFSGRRIDGGNGHVAGPSASGPLSCLPLVIETLRRCGISAVRRVLCEP
ncbi:Uncharacterised protein [Mycobacteroides abscessus subsp. abscessus]|nr:Uncharacterised protein [Mycobacteroides abscessus subsp. abscessus]